MGGGGRGHGSWGEPLFSGPRGTAASRNRRWGRVAGRHGRKRQCSEGVGAAAAHASCRRRRPRKRHQPLTNPHRPTHSRKMLWIELSRRDTATSMKAAGHAGRQACRQPGTPESVCVCGGGGGGGGGGGISAV